MQGWHQLQFEPPAHGTNIHLTRTVCNPRGQACGEIWCNTSRRTHWQLALWRRSCGSHDLPPQHPPPAPLPPRWARPGLLAWRPAPWQSVVRCSQAQPTAPPLVLQVDAGVRCGGLFGLRLDWPHLAASHRAMGATVAVDAQQALRWGLQLARLPRTARARGLRCLLVAHWPPHVFAALASPSLPFGCLMRRSQSRGPGCALNGRHALARAQVPALAVVRGGCGRLAPQVQRAAAAAAGSTYRARQLSPLHAPEYRDADADALVRVAR